MRRATDLATSVGGVALPNPVCTAAGTSGHGAELGAYIDLSRLGAVVVKSLAAFPWPGNPPPRVAPVDGGMLNSVGLQGPGVERFLAEHLPALVSSGARVVVSIWGRRVEEFAAAAAPLADAGAAVVAVEVNVSCPNLDDRARVFAHSPSATADAVAAAAACRRPLWAKLSPTTADLLEVAAAALGAGAGALTLVNTALGYGLDPASGRPLLGAGYGGLSGPALRPVALRAVRECRDAFPTAGIVGVGGVLRAADAVAMLRAGADAVEVGTASFLDPRASLRVLRGLERWCRRVGVARVRDLVGTAGAPGDRPSAGADGRG